MSLRDSYMSCSSSTSRDPERRQLIDRVRLISSQFGRPAHSIPTSLIPVRYASNATNNPTPETPSSATSSLSPVSYNSFTSRRTVQTSPSSLGSVSSISTSGVSLPWTGESNGTSSIPDTSGISPSKHQGHVEPSQHEIFCSCGTGFKCKSGNSISNYKRHMRSVHHEGPRIKCTVCGKAFQRSDYLKKHSKNIHNIE